MEKIDNDEGSLGQDNITIRYNSTHKHTDTYVLHACAIHTKLLAGYGSMRMLVQHAGLILPPKPCTMTLAAVHVHQTH